MAMREGHTPPTLPAGHTAPSGKKSGKKPGKKRTVVQVIVGLVIGMIIIAGIAAVRNSCTSEDMAMREALLTEMRKKTLLAETEQAKADAMIDLVKAYTAAGAADAPEAIYANSLANSNIERTKQLLAEYRELEVRYESYEQCD